MASRMDRYKTLDEGLTRSNKNKELYRQVYNAYDDYDNLIVPSNAKEITLSDLKKEIAEEKLEEKEIKTREEKIVKRNDIDNIDVYDINKMINKAVSDNNTEETRENTISNGSYLKKLKLDSRKTNIEQVKEMYDDIREEAMEEDESLLKTANLSLEILSDLKSDNDITKVSAPIKNEELPEGEEDTFYSSKYKFSDKDFEKEEEEKSEEGEEEEEEEDDEEDDEEIIDVSGGKFFFKILLLIIGLMLIVGLIIYLILYFGKA